MPPAGPGATNRYQVIVVVCTVALGVPSSWSALTIAPRVSWYEPSAPVMIVKGIETENLAGSAMRHMASGGIRKTDLSGDLATVQ